MLGAFPHRVDVQRNQCPRSPLPHRILRIEHRDERPVKDIVVGYTEENDVIIERWLPANVSRTWHSAGTCNKIAPREEIGLVDRIRSIYGVEGQEIADLRNAPGNLGANTAKAANTAFASGEMQACYYLLHSRAWRVTGVLGYPTPARVRYRHNISS